MTDHVQVVNGGLTWLTGSSSGLMTGIAQTMGISMPLRRLLLLLLLIVPLQAALADEAQQRRVLVGLKLFPAVLAASEALGPESTLRNIRVIIVYQDDENSAEELADTLQSIGKIKEKKLVVETVPINRLPQHSSDPPFGLFIAQRNEEDVEVISHYGQQHNVITFSPFRGDVERGILAGIVISDRILPYINRQTLASLPFDLRAFFLKVAEIYEP